MITYVNTVLVSTLNTVVTNPSTSTADGSFVVVDADSGAFINTITDDVKRIKIGMVVAGHPQYDHKGNAKPLIRWSNIINRDDVKSIATLTAPASDAVTEDMVEIDFANVSNDVLTLWQEGGKRIIIRLTFKDTPTRYRKWTESYEYVTSTTDTVVTIATNIAALINKQWKRARVVATADNAGKLTLTAMQYDDDNSVDTINRAEKVRFNANVYYTDPAAEGWESLNKHYPTGLTISKTPGFTYAGAGKLVRDRENQSFGYMGILNRGCCTWPIIQPAMRTDITQNYNVVTLEFENMYRAADDIFRKTKQTVEIYTTAAITAGIGKILTDFADQAKIVDTTTEDNSN